MERAVICPGRNGTGERLTLEAELRVIARPGALTVEHEPVPSGALELSICGTLYPRGWRPGWDIRGGGQNRDDLAEVIATPRVLGTKIGLQHSSASMKRVLEIWDRWPLNAMT